MKSNFNFWFISDCIEGEKSFKMFEFQKYEKTQCSCAEVLTTYSDHSIDELIR
jgi:hypothetical protein